MTFSLNGTPLNPTALDYQGRLQDAQAQGLRPTCNCMSPPPEMYIAYVNGTYIVKRMPSTGPSHAPSCDAFQPPEELSGLSQVQGSAFEENPEDGTTLLRLDFPLSIRGKKAAPPPPSAGDPIEAKTPDRKLTLTSLLHFLWHEADLVKWTPRMAGKRWWGVIARELRSAATNKVAKRLPMATRLFIPAPFKKENKANNAAKRNAFFHTLTQSLKSATPLGIVIAEYKAMEPTPHGARFIFKHLPDCHFFADKDLVDKFEKVFEEQLLMAGMVPDCHTIIIATFRMAPAGYPVLIDIGLMLTTKNWIPFEHMREVELIDAMTASERVFIKSMRFNLPKATPFASMMATDTNPPTAMFVTPPGANVEYETAMLDCADDGTYPAWVWVGSEGMPEVPRGPMNA